ncbi:agmatine deiminase family protein [Janibacter sp. G1551]|uniref:agmatine deiminase family protein n=1 Tax=Janibacter sp. G1551 TaxID=3420440 RepID=UPI003CFC2D72
MNGASGPLMPAEWETHERTWMAWPSSGYTLGNTPDEVTSARTTWAAVARAVARFEPVTMLVDPSALEVARGYLEGNGTEHDITLVEAALDDAWMRDIGPTFVRTDGALAAVDWVFNGWGAQSWASWEQDAKVATLVAGMAEVDVIPSPIVNEGGGIHVDGEGTVLLTETVQLDPGRNPGATRTDIEAELARTIGATTFLWLPRGLTRDYDEFGTRGHVDIVACFAEPGVVLLHWQEDESHPDHDVSREAEAVLLGATDARGRSLTVVRVPAPITLTDDEGPVDWSYINHLVCNGGVVACTFDDAQDERALDVLRSAYPGREVVGVDARPLFDRGGGIHCITQQQPRR